MFVYVNETNATLNVAFNTNVPVESPEVVIQGFKNGAKVMVNGAVAIDVANAEAFETARRPFVYQRDNKLNITFKAAAPVETPEVTIDAISEDKAEIVANGNSIRVTYTDNGVTYEAPAATGRKSRKTTAPAPEVTEPVQEEVTEG